jgi:hypothetical protein
MKMERDSIVANGMMSFLKESMIERSDGMAESAKLHRRRAPGRTWRIRYAALPSDVYTPETTVYKVPQADRAPEGARQHGHHGLQQERAGAQTIGDAQ